MTNLYKILETNTDQTKNQDTKEVQILIDLDGNSHKIQNTEDAKLFICVCGTCDFCMSKNGEYEYITLNSAYKTLCVDKDISVELKNYTNDTRVVVEYLGEING